MNMVAFIKYFLLISLMLFSLQSFADNPPMTDSAITQNIKSKILEDELLRNTDVNISTDKQVVSYSGMVDSESQASTLVEIAQSTLDVKDVDTSRLTVKGS